VRSTSPPPSASVTLSATRRSPTSCAGSIPTSRSTGLAQHPVTANGRPFLYFPLSHHFEQNFHVRQRLGRYGAGRAMDFEVATPETIADAIAEEIGREVDYRPVERDGAARAAGLIAELF
jgi:hypothetical protein